MRDGELLGLTGVRFRGFGVLGLGLIFGFGCAAITLNPKP